MHSQDFSLAQFPVDSNAGLLIPDSGITWSIKLGDADKRSQLAFVPIKT